MAKLSKKRVYPKQIRHWVYRLTGKSNEVITYIIYGKAYLCDRYHRSPKGLLRFVVDGVRFELYEYESEVGSDYVEIETTLSKTDRSGMTEKLSECYYLLPSTYDEFRELIESRKEATIFASL